MNMPATQIIDLLIVEDDEDDFVLTSALLGQAETFDFHIDWVSDPQKARKIFGENRHDICLMDYRLGAEVSINLVREALSLGFTAPIIMLTGQDDSGVEIEAAAAGAVDYLVKDHITREQLLRSIRYALARSEIQAERFERMRAETANRSKSEFLAVLSHEIRTPLTAIIGYTELLIHRHQHEDADLTHKLQTINRNGSHLLSLLNDTLDLSKIEAGKLETDIEKIELGPFVMNTISLIREMAEAKNLTLQVSARTALPRYIHTDAMRLRQVLFNLLGNAIKFTDTGTVELQLKFDAPALEFHVIDTGKGLSMTDLNKIFQPFSQLPSQGRKHGTGLGLTISQKLAHKLGGAITAHSIEGAGSRFILRIDPGAVDLEETAELMALDDVHDLPVSHPQADIRGHVIVVDDVEDIRDLIGHILSEAGINVLMANNGQEALELLGSLAGEVSMVLMDLNMPVLDGYETLRIMRERHIDTPAIALTAASLKGEREKCLNAGFISYLPKPVTSAALLAEIRKHAAHGTAPSPGAMDEKNILVVEDNEDANAAVCMLLQLLGYRTRGALNASEALAFFDEQKPSVVLSDLNLGESDGGELVQHMRNIAPEVRYFLLSGDPGLIGQKNPVLPPGVEGFIAKPVTLDMLTAALKRRAVSGW
jgi:signal transduction histidine kinase